MAETEKAFTKTVRPGIGPNGPVICEIEYSAEGNLSITGHAGGSSGQIRPIEVHEYGDGWDDYAVARFNDVWERWHLNNMRAGTPEQEEAIRQWRQSKGQRGKAYDYIAAVEYLKSIGGYEVRDPRPDTRLAPMPEWFPNLHIYKYGSGWLREEVPADVLEFLRGLPAGAPPKSPYLAFAEAHNLQMKAMRYDKRPDEVDFGSGARHFRCALMNGDSGNGMIIWFSQGSAHTIPPTIADVLGSLALDIRGLDSPFEEWACEAGYDPDSRKAEGVYRACCKTAEDLKPVLGAAYGELLQTQDGAI